MDGNGIDNEHNYLKDFVFSPNSYEMIEKFLFEYVISKEDFYSPEIKEVSVHELDPFVLPQDDFQHGMKRNAAYYFTTLICKDELTTTRLTREGYWNAFGNQTQILYEEEVIGFKQKFSFYKGNPPNGTSTNWVMSEYKLNPTVYLQAVAEEDSDLMNKIQTCVLSRIKRIDQTLEVEKTTFSLDNHNDEANCNDDNDEANSNDDNDEENCNDDGEKDNKKQRHNDEENRNDDNDEENCNDDGEKDNNKQRRNDEENCNDDGEKDNNKQRRGVN